MYPQSSAKSSQTWVSAASASASAILLANMFGYCRLRKPSAMFAATPRDERSNLISQRIAFLFRKCFRLIEDFHRQLVRQLVNLQVSKSLQHLASLQSAFCLVPTASCFLLAASLYYTPSVGAISFNAANTFPICSSSGTPSASAPLAISSRFTPRANALSFHFFFTDEISTSASFFDGRTSATAMTTPSVRPPRRAFSPAA